MANLMVGRQVDFNPHKSPANYRDTVLDVEHLTVRNANKFDVVKDVSFHIRGGEIFAIAGVSGNGQVELADAIAGMLKIHGQVYQYTIPAGVWQGGCLAGGGSYALYGCTVAPAFTPSCFENGNRAALIARYPDFKHEPQGKLSGQRRD